MKHYGLSTRLAMLMVLATLIMQVAYGCYRFSVEVPRVKQESLERIELLVEGMHSALSEALYEYNEVLANKLLNVFQAYEGVQTVWILDYDDSGIGVWARNDLAFSDNQMEQSWPLTFKGEVIGRLVVLIDIEEIETAAVIEIWRAVAFSVLVGFLALIFLFVIAQIIVTKPIKGLSRTVSIIESHELTPEGLKAIDNIKAYDEIETLRVSIKHILLELAQHIRENQQAMVVLTEFNRTLEEQVANRTHELKEAKDKAEVANRAKTDFLNVITHELRTPLNGVLGFSGILKNRDISDKDKQLVEGIEQAGNGLLILLSDIIDYVDLESKSLDRQTFSIHDALISVFNEHKEQAQLKNLEYIMDVDATAILTGDPRRLSILVRQLLSNAIKFTQAGSVILCCHKKDDGLIQVCVADTGIGMDESHYGQFAQSVFTQVEQGLDRSNGGMGLGLAIVSRICQKWPAKMWFEKNTPQGTIVCVLLDDVTGDA